MNRDTILEGFPYTVLGYSTLSAEDADFEQAPDGWSVHGTANDKASRLTRGRRGDRAKGLKRGRGQTR